MTVERRRKSVKRAAPRAGSAASPRARGADGDTPARIFAAADALFCERGYEGVSARDVAERAGVNKALVFYHFGSKAKLFDRVIERYYESHAGALSGAFDGAPGDSSLRERVLRMIDAYFDFIEKHRAYVGLVQQEVARGGSRLEGIRRNYAALFEWAARALDGVMAPTGPLSTRHFFLSFSGMMINYFTYSPLLEPFWGADPLSLAAREERRRHLHWVAGTLLDSLLAARERATEPR